MFSDTAEGAAATATIFSIVETAKANDLEPFWYMYALLIKLPELKTKEDFIPYLPQKIDREIIETLRNKHQSR
jgi:transposase